MLVRWSWARAPPRARERRGRLGGCSRGAFSVLGRLAPIVARAGIERTLRKYGGRARGVDELEATLETALERLQSDLRGRPYLLETFSYADIAMAQIVLFVDAGDDSILRMGRASRACFSDPRSALRFPDLVRWRNALYAGSRPPRARTRSAA